MLSDDRVLLGKTTNLLFEIQLLWSDIHEFE